MVTFLCRCSLFNPWRLQKTIPYLPFVPDTSIGASRYRCRPPNGSMHGCPPGNMVLCHFDLTLLLPLRCHLNLALSLPFQCYLNLILSLLFRCHLNLALLLPFRCHLNLTLSLLFRCHLNLTPGYLSAKSWCHFNLALFPLSAGSCAIHFCFHTRFLKKEIKRDARSDRIKSVHERNRQVFTLQKPEKQPQKEKLLGTYDWCLTPLMTVSNPALPSILS